MAEATSATVNSDVPSPQTVRAPPVAIAFSLLPTPRGSRVTCATSATGCSGGPTGPGSTQRTHQGTGRVKHLGGAFPQVRTGVRGPRLCRGELRRAGTFA